MSFYIIQGDIFDQKVDAIVLTASPKLKLEGSLGEEALKKCGQKLVLELEQTKTPTLSECIITNSYNIPANKIIHVVTPRWNGGKNNEDLYLKQSYLNCLRKLKEFGLKSIAFPLLSSGAYHYPESKSIPIATSTLSKYAKENEDIDIALVIYHASTWKSNKELFKGYKVIEGKLSETTKEYLETVSLERRGFNNWYKPGSESVLDDGYDAQELRQKLLFFIKAKGKNQQECYTGVVSKTTFDKIIRGNNYIPEKYTLVSLGINIGLDQFEINELLDPLGAHLDYQTEKDQIICEGLHKHHGEDGSLRIDEINEELVAMGCVPLKTN